MLFCSIKGAIAPCLLPALQARIVFYTKQEIQPKSVAFDVFLRYGRRHRLQDVCDKPVIIIVARGALTI